MKSIAKVVELKSITKAFLTYDSQNDSFQVNGKLDTSTVDKEKLAKDYQLSYMRILTNRNNGRNK